MNIEEVLDLEEINKSFVNNESKERIIWAYETFKEGLFLTTSGGKTSAALPNLTRDSLGFCPPIIFVDIGYFNDCTHNMLKYMENEGYDLRIYKSLISKKEIEENEIVFNAGSYTELITLHYEDFKRLVKPCVARISSNN